MHHHHRRLLLVTAVIWGIAAVSPWNHAGLLAAAFAQPQSIDRLASKTTPLTSQEQAQVGEYVEYWVGRLEQGEPQQIEEALRAMNDPLGGIGGVTRVFLDEYSRKAVDRLRQTLNAHSSAEVAVNAMKVASRLNTERALRFMVDFSDPSKEQRMAVRLWAAKGFQILASSGELDERQLSGPTRDLARAAANEEDWLVLRRQLEAIAAGRNSHEHLVSVLSAATERVKEKDDAAPSRMVESFLRGMVLLRNQWLDMRNLQRQEREAFGALTSPQALAVLELVEAHWKKAQEDARAREYYGSAVQSAETLLVAIDLQMRSSANSMPATALAQAWNRRDIESFSRQLNDWRQVISRAPYTQRSR